MQNKRLYIILGIIVVVVAAAAFVAGRLINGQAGPFGLSLFGTDMGRVSINITRAPELPTTEPVTNGQFVERKDNTITIQTFPENMGNGGAVIIGAGADNDTPKVEVVVTNETILYHDVTPIDIAPGGSEINLQQKLEPGALDDLHSPTMVMVWGRKNGDRIIAEVLVYTDPMVFKRP